MAPVTWPSANSFAGRTPAITVCGSPHRPTAATGATTATAGDALCAVPPGPVMHTAGAANDRSATPPGPPAFTPSPTPMDSQSKSAARPPSDATLQVYLAGGTNPAAERF